MITTVHKFCCQTILPIVLLLPNFVFGAGLAIWPMEQYTSPAKAVTYVASNQLEKAIAVEVICESWHISEDGEEIREPTQDLVAYPSQFILKGNTFRKVKVGLRNPKAQVENEMCYRVTIRELPISLDPEEPGTYRIYQASAYRTSFYVRPDHPKPQIQLAESTVKDGVLTVTMHNAGNAHTHLQSPKLIVKTASGKEIDITDKAALAPIAGHNMHAGITRRFPIKINSEVDEEVVGGTIQFEDKGILQDRVFDLKL